MKLRTLFYNLIFLLGLFFIDISAQNFNDAFRLAEPSLDYDSRTMAMGNSTLALGGNFASSLLNPAGLALLRTNVVELGFNSNSMQNSATFFNVNKNAKKNNSNFNQFALVMPLPTKKGSAVLAFGYNQLKDFNAKLEFDGFNPSNTSMIQTLNGEDIIYKLGLSYPVFEVNGTDTTYLYDETIIDGRLHQSGTIVEDGTLDSWVMSGAFEVSKNVFIGATLNILSGTYKISKEYWEDDYDENSYVGQLDPSDSRTTDFESFLWNDIIEQKINGWDFRLGLLYKMNSMLSFGANIKLPTSYQVEETNNIYGEAEFATTVFSYDSTAQYDYSIETPMELSVGVAVNLSFININSSVKIVDYSQMEFGDEFESKDLDKKNQGFEELFENTINFNLGTEVTLPFQNLKVRGGFIYNQSPFKGDAAEFDKKFITAGLGLPLSDGINIDVTYAHGWWNTVGDNYGYKQSRTLQEISVDKIMMSLSFSFM